MIFKTIVAVLLSASPFTKAQECTVGCVPCLSQEDKVINIAVLLERDTLIRALPVIYLAQHDLKLYGLKGPLEGWDVKIVWRDSECSSITAPLEAVQLHNQGKADVFLGPACDYALAPVIRFAKIWRTPVLSPGGKPEPFSNNPQFEMFVRLNSHDTELAYAVKSVCDHWNWKIVAILYEDKETDSAGLSSCHHRMSEIYRIFKLNNFTTVAKGYKTTDDFKAILTEVKTRARILTFCVENGANIKRMMMAAHELNMTQTGEFLFVNIDIEAGPPEFYKPFDRNSVEEAKAFSSMLTVTPRTPDSQDYRQFSKKVQQLANNLTGVLSEIHRNLTSSHRSTYRNASYSNNINNVIDNLYPNDLVTPYMASFYEGVMMFAEAFNNTLKNRKAKGYEEESILSKNLMPIGDDIIQDITNGTFYSHLRKENLTLMNNTLSDDYAVYNLDDRNEFKVVSVYWGQAASLNMTGVAVRWPGPNTTVVPKDSPKCGFNNELCSRTSYMNAIIGVLSILVIVLTILSIIAIRKYNLEKQISSMTWKISYSEIMLAPNERGARGRFGSMASLGKTSWHSQQTISSVENLCGRQVFIQTGFFKGNRVAVKQLSSSRVNITRPLLMELRAMKELANDHLVRLIGACFECPNNCLITEYCPRGSLQDVLENEKLTLDDMIKYSLLHDIVKGLSHLHSSEIKVHGNFKSTNCVVDSRFVLKITDFGILSLRFGEESSPTEYQQYHKKLWSAPEVLRKGFGALSSDQLQKADIYSMGIIMNEIFCRMGTFPLQYGHMASPSEIVHRVMNGESPPLRPYIEDCSLLNPETSELMRRCWHEDANQRPNLANIKMTVRRLNKENESGNILDNLLNRMVAYSENLESLVEERTKDYLEEKRKCEDVLYQLLPKSVARQLISGREVMAETYDSVTIYFSDIVGFTALSAESSPMQVVNMLNALYSLFDETISEFDVYKVETIGDAYMVVSGLPVRNENFHVREVARMAIKLLEAVKSFQIPHRPSQSLQLRIGVHSGPCVAGVVGVKMPRYCLFGDTVNTASRMESNGLPLKIHVSPSTQELLAKHFPTFQLQLRGEIPMKGKGVVTTYWLLRENKPDQTEAQPPDGDQLSIIESITEDKPVTSLSNPAIPSHEISCPSPDIVTSHSAEGSPVTSPTESKKDTNISIEDPDDGNNRKGTDSPLELSPTLSKREDSSSSIHRSSQEHPKIQKTTSCAVPLREDSKPNGKVVASVSLSLNYSEPENKHCRNVTFDEASSNDSRKWEMSNSQQSPLISPQTEKLKQPTRSSIKKISFASHDKDSATPLLVNSKSNSLA